MFAIMDRATRQFLAAGGTDAEFSATKAPRLFAKRAHAISALNAWRLGRWRISYWDDDGGLPEPTGTERNQELAAKRQAMDLEVIEVEVVEKHPTLL